MKNFVIEVKCQTASFRNPNFQNFHKSLQLPPPTTIIGFAGAALGFSPLQAQGFFDIAGFKIGISGVYKGKYLDTWKYNKGIRDMRRYDPGLDGSIIRKEYLAHAKFLIAFSSNHEKAVERLKESFEDPVYALTLGNSDSLAFIKQIEVDIDLSESNEIENCFVQGDVVNDVMSLAERGNLEFSIYFDESLTYDLPLRYDYDNDYGKRTISEIETYSLIGKNMKLNYKIKGIQFQESFIPLFPI